LSLGKKYYSNIESFVESPTPFRLPPLTNTTWIPFWSAVRYRAMLDKVYQGSPFEIGIPEKWYTQKPHKQFGEKG